VEEGREDTAMNLPWTASSGFVTLGPFTAESCNQEEMGENEKQSRGLNFKYLREKSRLLRRGVITRICGLKVL